MLRSIGWNIHSSGWNGEDIGAGGCAMTVDGMTSRKGLLMRSLGHRGNLTGCYLHKYRIHLRTIVRILAEKTIN